jgi:hypothetical protein
MNVEVHQIDEETSVKAPWQGYRFEINTIPVAAVLDPDVFVALELPGSTLTSINLKNGKWSIKGVIYASIK